ncbi:hypothetical protein [Halomonas tibetensis]|uniref:Uncharacterized protein n=1 Tax=Halomonas tibetensis TaxID=2259590 RepID=A0ABV7B8J8_9GAMM
MIGPLLVPLGYSLAPLSLLLPVTFIDFGLSYAFFAYPIESSYVKV